MAKEQKEGTRFLTVEEQLANIDANPVKINTADNSHHDSVNETETGNSVAKQVYEGGNPADLDPIPADAEAGEYVEPTRFDNGVGVPKEAKVEGRSQLGGKEPKNFRALNEDELSEGERPKSSLTVKDADTTEEKDAVRKAAKADTSFTKRSVSK
jgi:hypothetical protein